MVRPPKNLPNDCFAMDGMVDNTCFRIGASAFFDQTQNLKLNLLVFCDVSGTLC